MADQKERKATAFNRVLKTFKIEYLKEYQVEALEKLLKGQDVFVIQPTGSGKSLIYQSAPVVFDTIYPFSSGRSIALVISPLTSLMQDQVRYLKSVGISAEFIGEDQMSEDANQLVERGECQIVYGSPEAFLSTKRWRAMISNNVYKERLRLVAVDEAHCISHW
jgi:ATP-dependent DNA helicase RecQ